MLIDYRVLPLTILWVAPLGVATAVTQPVNEVWGTAAKEKGHCRYYRSCPVELRGLCSLAGMLWGAQAAEVCEWNLQALGVLAGSLQSRLEAGDQCQTGLGKAGRCISLYLLIWTSLGFPSYCSWKGRACFQFFWCNLMDTSRQNFLILLSRLMLLGIICVCYSLFLPTSVFY